MNRRGLARLTATPLLAAAALLAASCGDNHSRPDAGAPDAPPDADGPAVTVETDRGTVVGTRADGIRAFLGIPYAAPPTGALRWKPPAEIRWTEPRAVTQLGPRCVGVSLLDATAVRDGASEDCLSLNIWAPDGAAGAPVLVWLHGGGFLDGTGGDYPGDALARDGGIVVVTLNYRLGALGALAIPSAGGGGNLALLDQQYALQWIQRNIAAFGGDPAKVTLGGQSAGAEAACVHGAMPSSQGLFRALLLESGTCDVTQTPQLAAAAATALATQWGCAPGGAIDEACLRALPAETIVRGNLSNQVGPIIDGALLPAPPRAALAAGTFAQVPVLAGFNADEGLFFTDGLYAALPLESPADYDTALGLLFGPAGPLFAMQYPLADFGGVPRAAFAALVGDGFMKCPTRHLIASIDAPAFAYELRHAPSVASPKPVGAMHTAELPYVWGIPLPWTWWNEPGAGLPATARERELAAQIRGYWTSFVATLDPTPPGGGAPPWPAWSAAAPAAMRFAEDATAAAALPADPRCAFWDAVFGAP